MFYIFEMNKEVQRGEHANINSEFFMIALNGSFKITIDDGVDSKTINIDNPATALYIDKMIWKKMYDFSQHTIIMILSNRYYDSNEYIHCYDTYKNMMISTNKNKI